MSLSITDGSGSALISGQLLADLTDLVAFLYAKLHLESGVDMSITCVNEAEMTALHIQWMDLDGPTDVMSFPMDEITPGTPKQPVTHGILGDIVLCTAVAQKQAENAGHSLDDELCQLTTHGFLHLLGYDHQAQTERTQMFKLQENLLSEFLGRTAPTPTVK